MSCVLCNWELAIYYVDNFSIQLDYSESYSIIPTNQNKNFLFPILSLTLQFLRDLSSLGKKNKNIQTQDFIFYNQSSIWKMAI